MIFATELKPLDFNNPTQAVRVMANHIRYMQEQLEYTLMNLDSSNVIGLDLNTTQVTTGGGETWTGDSIRMVGNHGEVFWAGKDENGRFRFQLTDRDGLQLFYMTADGQLIFTGRPTQSIDCGEWD